MGIYGRKAVYALLRVREKAAASGEKDSWFYVGLAYEEGKIVSRDLSYAAQCYERGMKPSGSVGCYNRLGALYFKGEGVPQDYERGVKLLTKAYEEENNWGCVYLGRAYLYGLGVRQDYQKARELLERVTWSNEEAYYLRGVIYAQGLGVPADIKKGVEFLQKAPNRAEAREELGKYKKTLFGRWVRR